VTSRFWRHNIKWRHQWRHQSTRRRQFPTGSLLYMHARTRNSLRDI